MANMADLISKGLLKAGDKLVWKKKQLGITHIAEILANGNIKTQDGKIHKTPSGAAKHLNNMKSVDGWLVWNLESQNIKLGELREKLNS